MKTTLSIGILAGVAFLGYYKLLCFMHNETILLLYFFTNLAIVIGLLLTLCFNLTKTEQYIQSGTRLILLCIIMKTLSMFNWPLLFGIDNVRYDEMIMVAVYYAGIISFIISPFYVGWQMLSNKLCKLIANNTSVNFLTNYFFISGCAGLTFTVLMLLFS